MQLSNALRRPRFADGERDACSHRCPSAGRWLRPSVSQRPPRFDAELGSKSDPVSLCSSIAACVMPEDLHDCLRKWANGVTSSSQCSEGSGIAWVKLSCRDRRPRRRGAASPFRQGEMTIGFPPGNQIIDNTIFQIRTSSMRPDGQGAPNLSIPPRQRWVGNGRIWTAPDRASFTKSYRHDPQISQPQLQLRARQAFH